jgi:hypothetical protein
MIHITKFPDLPPSCLGSILKADRPVIISTVYMPDSGKMMLSIDNISMDGALEMTAAGTLISLKESNEAVSATGGKS